MQAKNSAAASEYAAKRAAALARANSLRAQRNADSTNSRRASSPISSTRPSINSTGNNHLMNFANRNEDMQQIQQVQQQESSDIVPNSTNENNSFKYENGIAGANVRIDSYGDTVERIRVRPSQSSSSGPSKVKPSISSSIPPSRNTHNIGRGGPKRSSSNVLDYSQPPIDPAGDLIDVSDRPISCSSYNGVNEIVFGGTDHALYAIDISNPRQSATKLYSKKWGHSDWVTSCTHLTNGRVLSVGMDNKLCLWSTDKRRCQEFHHHNRSITQVVAGQNCMAYSASYDGCVASWSLDGGERATENAKPVQIWKGHKSPVLELAFRDNLVASGGKDGAMLCWDTTSGECVIRTRAHDASITSLLLPDQDQSVITGGADGCVKLWDIRLKNLLSSDRHHIDSATSASAPVSGLATIGEHLIISGGADSVVVIRDKRRSGVVASFNNCNTGVYCVQSANDSKCVFVGDGAGMLFCYDVITCKLCYGIGASSNGAVKCIIPVNSAKKVVTAGEDGKILKFTYD
jgi:WD40 repeat protein